MSARISSRIVALVALVATLALLTSWSIPALAAAPKVRTYTVQPGDSIWSIAAEFYGSGDKYPIIYKFNKFIGPAPYILAPGQVLTLPEGAVMPEAQVEWLKKEVRAKPPRSLDWLSASTKMNLWKQYQVSTGDESAVHIVFEDDSDLRLGDNALLVIYGGTAATARRERRKTQVLLREGTVRGGLAALDGGTPPMVVETPSGVLEVNSTDTQIESGKDGSVVSVFEGEVEVKAEGERVRVPKDHGTVVEKGKKPEAPRPLPAPPGWSLAGEGVAVAVVPAGGRATFEAEWSKVTGARSYRVELAEDERFKKVIVNVEVGADTTRFTLEKIPVGSYFARVSARDASKLQGRPSKALRLDVVGLNASRRLAQDEGGRWEVAGLARLDLGAVADGLEWALDDGPFLPGREPTRVMSAGAHTVKVRRVGETIITPFSFHVLALRGRLEVPSEAPLPAGEGAREVFVEVRDERGRPASPPELSLVAEPGGALTLESVAPGRFKALVPAPPPPGPERIALVASWPDGVLAEGHVDVAQKFPEVPYVYAWRVAGGNLGWDGRTAATRLPSLAPIDRLGVEASIVSGDDAFALLTLLGELGLIDDRLAFDGALTLLRPPLADSAAQGNELGDLTLGARWLALDTRRVTLGPSVRLRLALAERDDERVSGFEPAALLRFRAARELWIDTRQGVLRTFGGRRDETFYLGDYQVIFAASDLLTLRTLLATEVALTRAEPLGLGWAAGLHLHLGRVRLGFDLGIGISGARHFGDVTGAVTLDFGLGTP